MADDGRWDRRSLLRGAAVVAGGAVTAPLLGEAATALAGGGDADALFKAGKFEQAGRAYEEILKKDPKNLHAARQRGYVGLLANEFPDAEKYLKMAIELSPGDKDANRFLGDCYIRQDKFSLSAPHWQAAGEDGYAKWFAAVRGEAYQVHGDIGAGAVSADGPDAAGGGLGQRRTAEALHVLHRRPVAELDRDGGQGGRAEPRRQSEDRVRGRNHMGVLRGAGILQAGRHRTAQHPRGLVGHGVEGRVDTEETD